MQVLLIWITWHFFITQPFSACLIDLLHFNLLSCTLQLIPLKFNFQFICNLHFMYINISRLVEHIYIGSFQFWHLLEVKAHDFLSQNITLHTPASYSLPFTWKENYFVSSRGFIFYSFVTPFTAKWLLYVARAANSSQEAL